MLLSEIHHLVTMKRLWWCATIGSDGTWRCAYMTNTSITDPEIIESSFQLALKVLKLGKTPWRRSLAGR